MYYWKLFLERGGWMLGTKWRDTIYLNKKEKDDITCMMSMSVIGEARSKDFATVSFQRELSEPHAVKNKNYEAFQQQMKLNHNNIFG